MSSQEAALHLFTQYLYHQRHIVDYFYIASFAVVIYDYLLTASREVTLVWFSPWTYTKVLFLLVRYIPLVTIYFGIYSQLAVDTTVASCRWHVQAFVWLLTVTITFADAILTIRTWAVWRREKKIGFGLAALLGASTIVAIVCNARFVKSMELQTPLYIGFQGCYITKTSAILVVDWSSICLVDAIVLAMMSISAYRAYISGDLNRFSNVVHRDGILFYICLLTVTFASLLCMAILKPELGVMLIPLQTALFSVFGCRIIINIRSIGTLQTNGTALHEDYLYEFDDLSDFRMEFRRNTTATAMSIPDPSSV